ncbi:MAG: hypothetical protein JXB34_07495 [Bacteroidales bacterium]|nr:hypothetical protein [Bacteroidales bacterium]
MRQFLTVITGIFICVGLSAQDNTESFALDTIIKIEGKVMPVEMTNVTTSYVRFKVPGSNELFTLPRKEIHKIIYKNGRIEEYNAMAVVTIDENAWQAVWLTEDPKDVVSLYKQGEVSAQADPNDRGSKASKKNAIIRLQKKAASMKGSVVLVTRKQFTGAYGEIQGYYIEGLVYGSEPPEEEKFDKDTMKK